MNIRGVGNVVHDVVQKVTMLLIPDVTVLLLRNVNDCMQMVEPGSQ